jgi:hypothetical protein
VIHSTRPARISPPTAISMSDTVQLPPIQSVTPAASARCITGKFTGSRTITAPGSSRKVEAASIQWPRQPRARSRPCTAWVYSPPCALTSTGSAASASRSCASSTRASDVARPTAGAAPPACEVLKNTGSMSSKSPSARMRSMSTEPTMPRQPMSPTRVMSLTPR